MHFTVATKIFAEMTAKAQNFTTGNSAHYLRALWLSAENGTVTATATTGSVTFTASCEAGITSPGTIGVNAIQIAKLAETLKQETVTVRAEEYQHGDETTPSETAWHVHIRSGKYRTKISGINPTWAPAPLQAEAETSATADGKAVSRILSRAIPFAKECEKSEHTDNVCITMKDADTVRVVAIDGFSAVRMDVLPADFFPVPDQLLIHRDHITRLLKWLPSGGITVSVGERFVFFASENPTETLVIPRTLSPFPDTSPIFGAFENRKGTLSFSAADIIPALTRAELVTDATNTSTRISPSRDSAEVYTATPEGESQDVIHLTAPYSGTITGVSFPVKKLKNAFSLLGAEGIDLTLTGVESPAFISHDSVPGYLSILMPMKVVNLEGEQQ